MENNKFKKISKTNTTFTLLTKNYAKSQNIIKTKEQIINSNMIKNRERTKSTIMNSSEYYSKNSENFQKCIKTSNSNENLLKRSNF